MSAAAFWLEAEAPTLLPFIAKETAVAFSFWAKGSGVGINLFLFADKAE